MDHKNIIKYLMEYKIKSKSRKKKDLIKEMREIAWVFGIKIITTKFTTICGSLNGNYDTIKLDPKSMHNNVFISAFLHELVHVHAYRNKIFKGFHSRKQYVDKYCLQQAWKAEFWVEIHAQKIMRKLYPQYKYYQTYLNNKINKEFVLNYYRN